MIFYCFQIFMHRFLSKFKGIKSSVDLFQRAFGEYKIQIVILTVLGFLSGLLEAIGVNALIPLFSFFSEDGAGGDDLVSQLIQKFFFFFDIQFSVPFLLIFIVLLFIFKALVLLLFSYIGLVIRSDYERKMRKTLFAQMLKANWPYLLKQKMGNLETILMVDVRMSTKLFSVVADSLMMISSLSMYLLIAVNISPIITFVTLGVGVLIFMLLRPLLGIIRSLAKKTAIMNKEIVHLIGESILGMKTIKSMFKENIFAEKGNSYFDDLRRFQLKAGLVSALSTAFIQPMSIVLISLVFIFSYYYTPDFNFAALAALIYLIHRIFTYIQMLQGSFQGINNLTPYLKAVLSYKDHAILNKEIDSATGAFRFKDKLQFQNIQFFYQDSGRVLKDITLTVRKGEMVGLIGISGAGKTTLFDLVLRLFNPSSGSILLDGRDISTINLRAWRDKIGYVSQDLFLLNDTIRNNISFFNNTIEKKEIVRAAKMAHIYDFIQSLPQKFQTNIGERGVRLSAGQRQRIAIARTLVRRPEILLLDEATSALDNESEIAVQKAIEELKGKTTILVVAHRLSTVVNSDMLLVLEDGKIIEKGKPQELLQDKESYFYKVYNIRK